MWFYVILECYSVKKDILEKVQHISPKVLREKISNKFEKKTGMITGTEILKREWFKII